MAFSAHELAAASWQQQTTTNNNNQQQTTTITTNNNNNNTKHLNSQMIIAPQNLDRTSRLFLAIWPEIKIRKALQRLRDGWAWPPTASLVEPESLHLTLHFLGNVPNSRLPELARGLKVRFHPFGLSIACAQLWPHGIAVLEPDLVPDDLLTLHASLDDALHRLGLPTEARAFHPHVTLARHANGATVPKRMHGQSLQWHVDSSMHWSIRNRVLRAGIPCCNATGNSESSPAPFVCKPD